MSILLQIGISFAFLVANVLALILIKDLSRRRPVPGTSEGLSTSSGESGEYPLQPADPRTLAASEILGWEFEYAKTTASEAMSDRHTMINFYLVVVSALGAGLLIVLGGMPDQDGLTGKDGLPTTVGTALLWLLCLAGWLYFLKLTTLRRAWYGSAQAMHQIRRFYIEHSKDFEPETLEDAFFFKPETLPDPDKAWNVFFYSAMLIALLNSAAYVAGGILLNWEPSQPLYLPVVGLLSLFGLAMFAFHVRMYFVFLRKEDSSSEPSDDADENDQ
jgi:hypothetical protein